MDKTDRFYANYGGVETVRVRACQEGLRSALAVTISSETDNFVDDTTNTSKGPSLFGGKRKHDKSVLNEEESRTDIETALSGLQLSCPPKGSREYFVEQSAEPLSALDNYITPSSSSKDKNVKKDSGKEAASINDQNIQLLLHHSSKLIELRTLDALLRTLRDRHLIVAARLRSTRDYWKWHINLSGGPLGRLVHVLRQQALTVLPWLGDDFRDRNQKEYELATATLDRELEWLGKVERLLLERPEEMEVGDLLSVVDEPKPVTWWNSFVNSGEENDNTVPKPSETMSSSVKLFLQSKNRMWMKQTEEWNRMARDVIKDSLDETTSSSFTPINTSDQLDQNGKGRDEDLSNVYAESRFLKQWAAYDNKTSDAYSWLTVLSLVDYSASVKRAGERRHFELSGLTRRIKRYDFLGIPTSALLLVAANSLHDKVIAPHKKEIVDFFNGIFEALWGIFQFR